MTSDTKAPGGFDPARQIEAVAPALGLTIDAAQKPVVMQFLSIAHAMARLVEAAPLPDDELGLAPIFRPGCSEEGR